MSKTGHASFDRWKDEFSATVRDIEAAMHERAISSSSSSSSSGTPAITDNDDNKDNATELIRRASTILAKLSSEAGKVSEREEPALKQELLDIYKACRMQIKTYKSLNKQRELFDDPSGGATTTRTKQTPMTKPATKPSVSEQRSSLFGSSAGTTPRNNNNNNNNEDIIKNLSGCRCVLQLFHTPMNDASNLLGPGHGMLEPRERVLDLCRRQPTILDNPVQRATVFVDHARSWIDRSWRGRNESTGTVHCRPRNRQTKQNRFFPRGVSDRDGGLVQSRQPRSIARCVHERGRHKGDKLCRISRPVGRHRYRQGNEEAGRERHGRMLRRKHPRRVRVFPVSRPRSKFRTLF
mmetsp:Transcript_5760/g.12171  ORF Transcript_5760/g.12171 Transcript_5760/m.12171 type:complete len:351 (+) Transcript_5760:264-1316(+)